MSDPKPYPLLAALGDGWRVLADPARGTTVFLHRSSGLWVEADSYLLPKLTEAQAKAIAGSLRMAVIEGKHGEVTVTVLVTKREDGSIRVSIGKVTT